VVHVAGGDDQDFHVSTGNHIPECFAQSAEHVKVAGTDGDGNDIQFRLPRLQERKLNLDGVFAAVRGAVLFERREAAQQASAHLPVRRNLAQRRLPRGVGHDRKRTSLARVIGAENHAALGNFQPRIDSAGDAARVDVSRMGSDASDGGDAARPHRDPDRRSVFPNVAQQFVSPARIKPASDSGSSYSGSHQ